MTISMLADQQHLRPGQILLGSRALGDADQKRERTASDLPKSKLPRILVVSYHFPPGRSVGGLRWGGFTKYLSRAGWSIGVVSATAGADQGRSGAEFVRISGRLRTVDDLYKAWFVARRRVTGAEGAGGTASTTTAAEAKPSLLRRTTVSLRREVVAMMSFPDESRGWMIITGRRLRKVIRSMRPDLVITSGPPHSTHLSGVLGTLGTGIPLIVDMRDPWYGHTTAEWVKHPVHGSRYAQFLVPRLERLIFRCASGAIANTSGFAKTLADRYPQVPVAWIPNGIDEERLPAAQAVKPYPGLSIAHVGTLYGGRDIGPVLRAMRRLVDEHPDARTELRIRLAGDITPNQRAKLERQIEETGLAEAVELLGMVPPDQALDLTRNSSLSLVLAQEQLLQVPAKLYETMGLQVPTLVIAEPEAAATSEARRLGAFSCEPGDVDAIYEVLRGVWRTNGRPPRRPPLEPIGYGELTNTMAHVLTAFADMTGSGPTR